jgi:hypothetical protein
MFALLESMFDKNKPLRQWPFSLHVLAAITRTVCTGLQPSNYHRVLGGVLRMVEIRSLWEGYLLLTRDFDCVGVTGRRLGVYCRVSVQASQQHRGTRTSWHHACAGGRNTVGRCACACCCRHGRCVEPRAIFIIPALIGQMALFSVRFC